MLTKDQIKLIVQALSDTDYALGYHLENWEPSDEEDDLEYSHQNKLQGEVQMILYFLEGQFQIHPEKTKKG